MSTDSQKDSQQQDLEQLTGQYAKVCERLAQVVTTDPIAEMEQQLTAQELETGNNIKWLDEALELLTCLSDEQNRHQLPQLIENVENFVSKSSNDSYDKAIHIENLSKNN
jgi:hypothetical protein